MAARWCRWLAATGTAAALLVTGCADGDPDAPADAGTATTASTSSTHLALESGAIEAFLDEVRLEDGDALVGFADDQLLVDGQVYCDALAATGSALDAAVALQQERGTYDGQTRLIEVARSTLCPDQEDR